LDERGLSNTPLQHMLKLPIAWVYYYRDDLDKALEGAITGVKYAEEQDRKGHHHRELSSLSHSHGT
jgi:hypothetical protein